MNDGLDCEFLSVFSRMEYALKASKTYLATERGFVQADWRKFAEDNESLIDNETIQDSIEYFFENPPRKQVFRNDELEFKEENAIEEKNTKKLIDFVKTVRNNLFHGGKHHRNEDFRDELLLKHSLEILKVCKILDEEVKRIYED